MKNVRILLNPLFWLAMFVLFAMPIEIAFENDAKSNVVLICDIAVFRLNTMNLVQIPFVLTMIRFAYIAIKRRFFTPKMV